MKTCKLLISVALIILLFSSVVIACDKYAAQQVQGMLNDIGCSWVDTKNIVNFSWGSDWDYYNADQRLKMMRAFADSDACLSGKARNIKFYRIDVLVGEASSSGIRLK